MKNLVMHATSQKPGSRFHARKIYFARANVSSRFCVSACERATRLI
jgi:hypothetical protein